MTARSSSRARARERRRRAAQTAPSTSSPSDSAEDKRARSLRRVAKAIKAERSRPTSTTKASTPPTTEKDNDMSTSTRPVTMREHQMRRRHFHARFGDRPDPLALRAERGLLASLAASKRALSEALAVPCEQHRAGVGEPCWEIPRGVCGARVDLAHTVRERY